LFLGFDFAGFFASLFICLLFSCHVFFSLFVYVCCCAEIPIYPLSGKLELEIGIALTNLVAKRTKDDVKDTPKERRRRGASKRKMRRKMIHKQRKENKIDEKQKTEK
jgi:hypothetical protein